MPTLQSRWRKYNATPGAHARRQRSREAASIAGPAPLYPPTAPLHGDWLGGCINGHTVIMRLMRDPQHRSDQWAAEVDGKTVADAAGLTRLHDLLRACWPKAPSLRALATAPQHWTERDERDAAAA
mgnify:FL=1